MQDEEPAAWLRNDSGVGEVGGMSGKAAGGGGRGRSCKERRGKDGRREGNTLDDKV